MVLKQITLSNFRSFEEVSYSFEPNLTMIVGENARGKTNLLESIYTLLNGMGFRECSEEELMRMGKHTTLIKGVLVDNKIAFEHAVSLTKKETFIEKRYMLNKVKKRYHDYINEQTKAILFSPEQLEIVTGSPDIRRQYINRLISFYDLVYRQRIQNFESALRKRNKVLEFHKDIKQLREDLVFWNDYLEEQSGYIVEKRQEYIDYLNKHTSLDSKKFQIMYLKNEISTSAWEQVFEKEEKIRKTMIGPQKEDFQISMVSKTEEKNIHHYGSRSEQRLGVFWLKINEILYYEEMTHKKPILLLDDIFSELDMKNKKLVFDLIGQYQTFLTTTEENLGELIHIEKTIIRL